MPLPKTALADGTVATRPAPAHSIESTYGNPQSLAFRLRAKRFAHVRALIESVIARKGSCRIADIGGTEYYWDICKDYVASRPLQIDLINLQAVAVKGSCFRSLQGDATRLGDIDDNAYDLVHSNSVIEHVGNWDAMSRMAANVRRLAPAYYVQTPNFWFPIEPHFRAPFFHWMPEQIRYRLLMTFNLGFGGRRYTVDGAMRGLQTAALLDRRQLAALFPCAEIRCERVYGLTKSIMAVRTA